MKTKNAVLLFTAAFIWGTAFVAQSVGMEYLGPFGFNGIRNFVGSLALFPCIFLLNKINRRSETAEQTEHCAGRRKACQQGSERRNGYFGSFKSGIP